MKICPVCGTETDTRFCPECGAKIPQEAVCPLCGCRGDSRFCPQCGAKMVVEEEKAVPAVPVSAPVHAETSGDYVFAGREDVKKNFEKGAAADRSEGPAEEVKQAAAGGEAQGEYVFTGNSDVRSNFRENGETRYAAGPEMPQRQEPGDERLSDRSWFIIVMLVVFWPVGLYLMWTRDKWNLIARTAVTVGAGILYTIIIQLILAGLSLLLFGVAYEAMDYVDYY